MTYIRPLTEECQWPGCVRNAKFEVVSNFNGLCGVYCTKHGKMALKKRIMVENDICDSSKKNSSK